MVANAEALMRWLEAQTLAVVESYVNEKVKTGTLLDARGRRGAIAGEGDSNPADGSIRENTYALGDVNHARRAEKLS
jgi:hypothetical protein